MTEGIKTTIVNLLREKGFTVKSEKTLKGFRADIYAENPKTKQKCIVDVNVTSPALTSSMLGLCRLKKDAHDHDFYALVSPYGTSLNAGKLAEECGVCVYTSVDKFAEGLAKYFKSPLL